MSAEIIQGNLHKFDITETASLYFDEKTKGWSLFYSDSEEEKGIDNLNLRSNADIVLENGVILNTTAKKFILKKLEGLLD